MKPIKIIWAARAVVYKLALKKIGLPSYIGKPTFIEGYKRISVGKRCRIFPHIRMDVKRNGKITIEDNVYIGENCHLTSEDYDLRIGSGTNIMENVCITNIDHNYKDINLPVLEQGYSTKDTKIGKNCFIGHGAMISAGVQLGDHCVVGAGSVVLKNISKGDIPSNCVIVGVPAKIIKQYNFFTGVYDDVNKD